MRSIKKILTLALALNLSFYTYAASDLESIPDMPIKEKKAGFHGIIGLGAANLAKFSGAEDNETIGIPIINVDYNDIVYFKFNRLGTWLWKPTNDVKVGLELGMRKGWDAEDIQLNGLQDRDNIIVFGVNSAYNKGNFKAEVSLLAGSADDNEFDESPGSELVTRFGYTFLKTNRTTVTATVKVELLSEETVTYLYGTSTNDSLDATTNVTAALSSTYRLGARWIAIGALGMQTLGDEITDSEIVEDDTQSIALLGVSYAF